MSSDVIVAGRSLERPRVVAWSGMRLSVMVTPLGGCFARRAQLPARGEEGLSRCGACGGGLGWLPCCASFPRWAALFLLFLLSALSVCAETVAPCAVITRFPARVPVSPVETVAYCPYLPW